MPTAALHVLRVFTGDGGAHGNELGVFLDGTAVPESRRQAVAAELGFAETVYVEDPQSGELRIHTPTTELPFAGHPLVGTAWLLHRVGHPVGELRPPGGTVPTWSQDGAVHILAEPDWSPPFELRELASPQEVLAFPMPDDSGALLDVWAWTDERAGHVRSRVFAGGVGVPEDEATGAAALRLAAHAGRPLRIEQGRGSILLAAPEGGGRVRVGGCCVAVEERLFEWT